MAATYLRLAARRDLISHYAYHSDNADIVVADRFLTSAEFSFEDLTHQTLMGAPLTFRHSALHGMRKWRVKDFDNFICHAQTAYRSSPCRTRHRIGGASWDLIKDQPD